MTEHEASRTLVKSPPELWAECSDASSLARHLGRFGEIRITTLKPETAVAWEGEDVRGTVTLEPAGWGTRVILTATPQQRPTAAASPSAASGDSSEPASAAASPGLLARLLARLGRGQQTAGTSAGDRDDRSHPAAGPIGAQAEVETAGAVEVARDEAQVLTRALDSLGMAHHRPFSRG